MKQHWVTMVVVVTAGSALLTGAGAAAHTYPAGGAPAASTGGWHTAQQVPGLAALNTGDFASVSVVSCASPGDCTATGFYATSTAEQVFVVNETNRHWGQAEEVPGLATLDGGNESEVLSLSCASAGNCAAGGTYTSVFGPGEAFVANETNGTWGTAEEVPGTGTLNASGDAETSSVSCRTAGNCSAGGSYKDGSGNDQAFVVTETHGTWGTAEEVPGTAALNTGGRAGVNAVSCPSPGTCSAGGFYAEAPHPAKHQQAFVVSETNGTWGTAEEVPGIAALNHGQAGIDSVSCGFAGNCGAGGSYKASSGGIQAFVVNEISGTWGSAEEVPGTAALNKGGRAGIGSVSCSFPSGCSASGEYVGIPGGSLSMLPFVVDETNGTWGTADEIPGIAKLNNDRNSVVYSLSCAAAANCSAAGSYQDASGSSQAFVVNKTDGIWRAAEEIPGLAALNVGGAAQANSVSCPGVGRCSAGGSYSASSGVQAFVVNKG
jgi:hypothetical protein